MQDNNTLNFKKIVPFCFFLSSYLPLSLILICRILKANKDYLYFGGFSAEAVICFFQHFWFLLILILFSLFGFFGTLITIRYLEKDGKNGDFATITNCNNQNSQFLIYFLTYLFPLFFQKLEDWTDIVAIIIFFIFVCTLYINSTMMIVNPILSLFNYHIYEVSVKTESENDASGFILTKSILLKNNQVKIYEIGNQVYYGEKF